MLFSLTIDGYISAKKSIVNDSLPEKFKQSKSESMKNSSKFCERYQCYLLVGLRKWKVRRALARLPDSGGTYLQLEKVTTTFNGIITNFTSGGKHNFV